LATTRGVLTMRPEAENGGDEPFLFRLFAAGRAPEMALMPLDETGKAFLLRTQFRSMTASYRQQFPAARFEIVELDGMPIGRLITDPQPDCIYYVDIALLPETRRGGIATALMTAVLDEPRQLGLPARVKVLSHNVPSLRLCQRIGFALRAEIPPFVELEWHAQNDRTG
jgi:GNAT superfamily N-acetyltransferase